MPPFKIGFGYKAQRGKDTACRAIVSAFGTLFNVRQYAFADALREEVNAALFDRWAQDFPSAPFPGVDGGMHHLCKWAGVAYDPAAPKSSQYPYGKQRALLQWWGTEYRRAQDPDYWVKRLNARIEADAPEYALISGVRFLDEFNFCDYRVRMDRPGFEVCEGRYHLSERSLDTVREREWDHIIEAGSPEEVKEKAVRFFYSRFAPSGALPDLAEAISAPGARLY